MNTATEKTIDERVGDELERLGWYRHGGYIAPIMRLNWIKARDAVRARIEALEKQGDE